MQNISDIIEQFIISTMGKDNTLHLSRNDLAQYFKCAPSQINYVLTTRFNINRGYLIQSQRGGGGFIKVFKIENFDNHYLKQVIETRIGAEISFKDATYILEDLVEKKFLTKGQAQVLSYALSSKSLALPIKIEDTLRANILKSTLIGVMKEANYE